MNITFTYVYLALWETCNMALCLVSKLFCLNLYRLYAAIDSRLIESTIIIIVEYLDYQNSLELT